MTVVLVMFNNYFHDLATGCLFGAGVAMWALGRWADRAGDDRMSLLRAVFPSLSRFALGALVWVLIGGIPRAIYFTTVEMNPEIAPADARFIVPALAVKHVVLFLAVASGLWMWWATRKRLAVARAE